ncbi:MAG: undecaprenyl/decaprenyl-phosphate alpha-N-acetylglucosaminyl 1-phosphate transferase [Bacteroidia bacterium]|nr:undecaprenyl/decaprenyl-phosphate alpha-N-acetylglucosaminyl 1-phosphate transferase [Bacteroidia bacterium]
MEKIIVIVILCSTLFSFLLNRILYKFSSTLGIHNNGKNNTEGNIIRWASTSKPTVGGIVFFIVFILAALVVFIMQGTSQEFSSDFLCMLVVVTLGFMIGLQDDAYNTNPLLKFGGQLSCGIIMVLFGVHIDLFGVPVLDYALTIFWVVGIMNSINLLDNMDGVTATVSLMIIVTTLILMRVYDVGVDPFFITLIAVSGGLVGFLILNWKPSKIYMGDTGSQFLGVLLAFIGVKYLWNIRAFDDRVVTSMQIIAPVMTFLVPILDTSFVTMARIMRRQSPFVGGKDHLAHHLTHIGVKEGFMPVLLGLVSVFSGILAIFASKYVFQWNHGFTALFSGYLVAAFIIFWFLYKRGERIGRIRERWAKRHLHAVAKKPEAAKAPQKMSS